MKEDLSRAIYISTNVTRLKTGETYFIDAREFMMTETLDGISYVDVYDINANYLGMAAIRDFAVIETEMKLSQAEEVLRVLKGMYPNCDTLYEDMIISEVGIKGLYMLRMNHLIETCGTFNSRKLYAI